MVKLTGVLIGCGTVARAHLAALAELDNVEVAALCDLSPARAEATAERFGIGKWYSNYEELLAHTKPDLIHITTPPSSHFSIAKSCLTSGLNVLCEKPITVDYQEFSILKQLATENKCVLMEDQNLRFNSSVRRIQDLISSGMLGDLIDVQIELAVNLTAAGNPYLDQNAVHFSSSLRGGVIGDFLPHIAYLAYMFTGSVRDVRTIWRKHTVSSPLPTDEFRALIKGERATAQASFSGNAQPSGFWVRVVGTRMHAEINLYEPPRFTVRRLRNGEPALVSFVDGIAEARDVMRGTVAGFWRKLGGTGIDDGLRNLIARTYGALERHEAQPIPLWEIDEVANLVDLFNKPALML